MGQPACLGVDHLGHLLDAMGSSKEQAEEMSSSPQAIHWERFFAGYASEQASAGPRSYQGLVDRPLSRRREAGSAHAVESGSRQPYRGSASCVRPLAEVARKVGVNPRLTTKTVCIMGNSYKFRINLLSD